MLPPSIATRCRTGTPPGSQLPLNLCRTIADIGKQPRTRKGRRLCVQHPPPSVQHSERDVQHAGEANHSVTGGTPFPMTSQTQRSDGGAQLQRWTAGKVAPFPPRSAAEGERRRRAAPFRTRGAAVGCSAQPPTSPSRNLVPTVEAGESCSSHPSGIAYAGSCRSMNQAQPWSGSPLCRSMGRMADISSSGEARLHRHH